MNPTDNKKQQQGQNLHREGQSTPAPADTQQQHRGGAAPDRSTADERARRDEGDLRDDVDDTLDRDRPADDASWPKSGDR